MPATKRPNFDKTRVLPAFTPNGAVDEYSLALAVTWLQAGWPVVVPSETVYGLAAVASDAQAVARIFEAKGRPSDNPLIVHVSGIDQAASLSASPSQLAQQLAAQFWPGPLTLVVDCADDLPWVTAGLDSIALRHPHHAFFHALIEKVGPLAAPSANRSGYPSPTRAEHAEQDLQGLVPLVIDGGAVEHGLESTVVDARGDRAIVLRPGAVMEKHWLQPADASLHSATVRSPGLKYRHYCPRAEVWLYPASPQQPSAQLLKDQQWLSAQGCRVAIIGFNHYAANVPHEIPETPELLAKYLFDWLRKFDDQQLDCILIEGVPLRGIGRAIMDRLTRAARQLRRPELQVEQLPLPLPQRQPLTHDLPPV